MKPTTAKSLRRWLLYYPILLVVGCHTLLTGSPIPLSYIEELTSPRQVTAVTSEALILDDGRHVALPYMESLPATDELFLRALEDGVEVMPDGEVIGLLRVYNICGNDPVAYRILRVNLSDLAAVISPSRISSTALAPGMIRYYREEGGELWTSKRVDGMLIVKMRSIRKQINHHSEKPDSSDDVIGNPGQHDRRTGGLIM